MKTIKVKLSNQGMKELLEKVNTLKKDLEKANEKIVDRLADYALSEIQTNFSMTGYQDGNEDVSFFKRGSKNKKTVGTMGSQVLYDEFGTGTAGAKTGSLIVLQFSFTAQGKFANEGRDRAAG